MYRDEDGQGEKGETKRKAEMGIWLSRDREEHKDEGFKEELGWRWRSEAAF